MYKNIFLLTLISSSLIASTPVDDLIEKSNKSTAKAMQWAAKNKYPTESIDKSSLNGWNLIGFENGRPIYYSTLNQEAAITTNTSAVRQALPYNLSGSGLSIGIWDLGSVLPTHNEVNSRVHVIDNSYPAAHSSHVGGTLAASGVNPLVKGMAPEAFIISASFGNDFGELPFWIASDSTEALSNPYKVTISNHSYGPVVGWVANVNYSGNSGFHYLDDINHMYDMNFGNYSTIAESWDEMCSNYPYWLPFLSAGNDRDDSAPAAGTPFSYIDTVKQEWAFSVYDPAVHPGADYSKGGFDTIIGANAAKNVMTIGAIDDAVTNGARDLSKGVMSNFSGWGPTDDGRIKPDVVANGVRVTSMKSSSVDGYTVGSGTSMSSPNAAGSALLLQELYSSFRGTTMPASMLKGIIIHTADDLGRPGPDYEFGWGVMNTKAAADVILCEQNDLIPCIITGSLSAENPEQVFYFTYAGLKPIRATLSWTDPKGTAVSGLDNRTSVLVHDLDLRVTDLTANAEYLPYVLDPNNPSADAVTGDNLVDPVEQVFTLQPTTSGIIEVRISHKGTLTTSEQAYSLILSGLGGYTELAVDSSVDDWAVLD
ncbi:MAG: S8 family serine peptidase [Sumerlaeia bacterium]